MKKILITGGTGLIGSRLTQLLRDKGYRVAHLVRSPEKSSVEVYRWNPRENFIEDGALEDVAAVVHLAGLDISAKRWNQHVKDEILFSRVETARLLRRWSEEHQFRIPVFVSASGISYYGTTNPVRPYEEQDNPGRDFMARVTVLWEQEAHAFTALDARVVTIRTGVVLARDRGALKKLALPVRLFVGAPLGSGQQVVNWIHLDDLCSLYLRAIDDESFQDAYNAVAPHPVTNEAFTNELARVLKRPRWAPNVPAFLVRLISGEVAYVVLEGGAVSAGRVIESGFTFQYPTLSQALQAIYG